MQVVPRRKALHTLLTGSVVALSGCTGPVIPYRGPNTVEVYNHDATSHTVQIEISSDGESILSGQYEIDANDDIQITQKMPGRKIIGERNYDLSVKLDDNDPITENFEYGGGFSTFEIVIREDGSLEIDTLVGG